MDFWESLSGELVTVRNARAISKPNQKFGDTWVVGDWRTTGDNARGGLTVTDRDGNPESLIILSPLDGSSNPRDTKLGDALEDITGVMTYAFGNYGIYPMTALSVTSSRQPALPPPTNLKSNGQCSGITMGQYNVENLSPNSDTFDDIAQQITTYLGSPDIVFLQEIQDNNGAANDGTVDANQTLSMLVDALQAAGSTISYDFIDIDPVDDQEGGQPGGNIRNAYIYNTDILRLRNPNPGSSTQATQVLAGPHLSLNPGRIDPSNSAWDDSRVPLVAEWETNDGMNNFFTVNVHWTSRLGSSSLFGDPRPPISGGIDQRQSQAQVTGFFINQIIRLDRDARVISAGDYNEFAFVEPMETFVRTSGLVDLDDAAGNPKTERYTYVFAQNSQQLDHMHVSPRIAGGGPQFEHVHVSSWVSFDDQVSDHDPSVTMLNLCE
jgi:predicted extracellular nuclease